MSELQEQQETVGGASLMLAWRPAGRRVLVVGGGAVAAGRVQRLLEADADIHLVAPDVTPELRRRAALGELFWSARRFRDEDLEDVTMVLTAIDDAALSAAIGGRCRRRGVPVNVADVPELCDFYFCSTHRDGPLQVAVATNGTAPAVGARLMREIARGLPPGVSEALRRFDDLRKTIRAVDRASTPTTRMRWLTQVGREWSYEALARLDGSTIASLAAQFRAGHAPRGERGPAVADARDRALLAPERAGTLARTVTLVGAGPGDPELLTLRAREALRRADLVLADALVPAPILALVAGELRVADKSEGRSQHGQRELERWAIEAAGAGREVVRLKIGDPYVFGRAPEEIARLVAAGCRVDVVPGLSSALVAPAAAGISLTERGVADRFTVITGQGAGGRYVTPPAFRDDETLVFLMAVGRAGLLSAQLQERGWPARTPVAVIERASHADERVSRCELRDLAECIASGGVRAPAVIVVGEVARSGASAHAPPPSLSRTPEGVPNAFANRSAGVSR